MSVTPSLKIQNPNNILGMMQNAEYNLGIFIRKILGHLDAQYVTPGPFSIFRKEVFEKVGMYHHAHNTEDLEMALRIQQSHYKIKNAHKALVYTVAPRTVYKLYKQRVRWTGGFMQNLVDYKHLLLNPKYGTFGLLVLPASILSTAGSLPLIAHSAYQSSQSLISSVSKAQTIGFHPSFHGLSYEWLVYHITTPVLFGLLSTAIVIFSVWYGMRITGDKNVRFLDFVFFLFLYSFISPFWLVASVYNTIRNRDAAWR
jgi:cellulose synthase/poly-beta-1,6-N-acetylglucosamine synthase-like glycosyltransferase